MPPRTKGKSKKELLTEQIAAAVGAGREVAVETVDFSDPNRPKTCLEVDFPIVLINQIAGLEASSGALKKPIYGMSKWWARRQPSVFRSMLIAAAMKTPDDESKTAKAIWDAYYSNHQKRGILRPLNVVDPFMGGGTTIVEGSRLGMQMFGCDLNPVAWFVVKNEMAQINITDVKQLLADVEAEVKPMITPYYFCHGPAGEKGKWFRRSGITKGSETPAQSDFLTDEKHKEQTTKTDWEELPASFDIFAIPWHERQEYRYDGPEIIYTFWAKHGTCERKGCGHRTPIMSSPVVAIKTLTVDAWRDVECSMCKKIFDVERQSARLAPDVPLFVSPEEIPFAVMDNKGRFACPHCGKSMQDANAFVGIKSLGLGKSESKSVEHTLFVHPQWLTGCPKCDEQGREYGGSSADSIDATSRWNNSRAATIRLLEVRGKPPEIITCPETGVSFSSGDATMPKRSTFTCAVDGSANDVMTAVAATGKTSPVAPYAVQGYSKKYSETGSTGGRFYFAPDNASQLNCALAEWNERKESDLKDYWPRTEVPYGFMTVIANSDLRLNYGYTHWWKMFSPHQMLVLAQLLKAIWTAGKHSKTTRMYVLGAFQQFLRCFNGMSIWHLKNNQISAFLSNPNFHPKACTIESSVFSPVGDGSWMSATSSLIAAKEWTSNPWELVPSASDQYITGQPKSTKVRTGDPITEPAGIRCSSATELDLRTNSQDLVITDPPFGGLLHYSELSDFFYVWLRLVLRRDYPEAFEPELTPKALEAVANPARQPQNADAFYQRILTDCWRETFRVLKPGGILAFTFHHSEDEPWVGVLESLFDAGFYLEATYPIRSDESKGEGEFGSKTIEYDIIHVCRKRMTEPQSISWARLRRQITDEVRRLKTLLTQHHNAGLPAADLQVIKRGKALEYFSRHYGKVYVEQGREFTIREALVGINQLLDDDTGTTGGPVAPPSNAEPYTRQFFRLFYETTQVPRDQMQKFLRGTGIAPSDFEERGWCSEKNKVFTLTPPVELAREWRGASRKGMARDFDQTMFLVGACVEGSNIRVTDTLDSQNFAPHPATEELVDWLCRHGGTQEIKFAAQRARTIYRDWLPKNKAKMEEQLRLFDLET